MSGDDSNVHFVDIAGAQDLARRYRYEFIDLRDFGVPLDVLKKVPVELMFRYNFVPLEETADGRIAAAFADPSQLMLIDEVSLLLGKRILTQPSEATASVKSGSAPKNRLDPMIRMYRSERHSSPNRIHAQVQHRLLMSKSSSEIARITHGCWLAVWSDLL